MKILAIGGRNLASLQGEFELDFTQAPPCKAAACLSSPARPGLENRPFWTPCVWRFMAVTLMIDEGFGALDARALDMVVEALESLQSQGRKVGVISHVEALTERIPVQVRVEK